ncbi:GIY-YIG nuclease family protein [Bradyrhizobium sp. AUGA SZCCT0431]|uniref:GIY-YIG nuclease family protein n=1 Tax=Bradyrhizobium sp. AUGA SZCCT0431 TaxID=2807674 RepID=UPI001BAC673F|nr:GIY-YIG nuclease family protein [Bradyrhizobium sp. AUGA SZCCT0431]MBR1141679.1 GIY-YIG nuclease family protein [Bradyrhizobium sp. AUGA SZCCT0431]
MTEIVYVLINEAMPGLIKIGRTNGDLAIRIRTLYSTGVPLPFELFYACEVADGGFVERNLHEAFGDHRVSKGREFFRLAAERARAAMLLAAIKEVKLGDEIFETTEVKAEVEAAKRRSRFKLSMIGIKPGTELQLFKDPTIICTTVDEGNQVNYHGDITSLSDAALQAHTALGDEWPSASGPWAWGYKGKRLDELRREIEDQAD